MEHKRLSHLLIGAGAAACAGLAVLFLLYAPVLGLEVRDMMPEYAFLFWPALLYVWAIGGMYMAAMWQYMRISLRIGQDNSFCAENAQSLRVIGYLLLAGAGMWALLMIAAVAVKAGPEALVLLLAAMASGALGVLAYAIGLLVQRAAQLQEENELTI